MPENNTAKKHQMKLRNKKFDTKLSKKKDESSDSDSTWVEDGETIESENISSEIESEEELDMKEYRTMLSKIFPSKYITEKAKNTPSKKELNELKKQHQYKARKLPDSDSEDNKDEDISVEIVKGTPKSKNKTTGKSKKDKSTETKRSQPQKSNKTSTKQEKNHELRELREKLEIARARARENDTSSESEEEDSDESSEDDNVNTNKFNIIFTIADRSMLEDDEEDDEDYTDEDDEDEDCDSSECEDESEASSDESEQSDSSSSVNESSNSKLSDKEIISQFKEMADKLKSSGNKKNKLLKEIIKTTDDLESKYKEKVEKKQKKNKKKNLKKFKNLMKNKNIMNDISFFKEKLTCAEQEKVISELESIQNITKIEKPYRISLLESTIPPEFKSCALKKLNQLRYMDSGNGEYYKLKNWVDTFMQIPFGKRMDLPITLNDGVEKCHEFMDNAKKVLDAAVYGLNDAKLQIMQMVGQWISNPDAIGTSIAIQGPMGTGKTTLVKDGISKILNREFAFIALGGATDASFLEGHSYTYEGSTWGKIVDILIKCKTMNPVIYFDELDKVSETPKGDEIIGILTHLTDTSQNSKFHDKYFSEIDFDLSKCLFIFSYNDESKVNPILKDRMYRINTTGYNKEEKTIIAKEYLLPRIREQVNFTNEQVLFETETIQNIIDQYTSNESGVRNLKRCLEIIYTKLNLYRLMKPGTNLFEKDMSLKIEFPLNVDIGIVSKLLKKSNDKESVPYGMYS